MDLACGFLQYSRDTQKATRTWAAEQRGIYYSPEPDYLSSNPGLPVKLGEVTLCFSASFSLCVKQRVVAVPQRDVMMINELIDAKHHLPGILSTQ